MDLLTKGLMGLNKEGLICLLTEGLKGLLATELTYERLIGLLGRLMD